MSSRRTLILIVAVIIGGLAAFSLFRFVNGVEDEAYGNARRVEVFVVKQDIPKGLPGDQAIGDGYVEESLIPQEFRPATSLTDIEAIRSKVSLNDMSAGQVVVDGMFVDPQLAVVTNSQRIEDGRVAITISVDQVRGVANLVVPGDRVNMIIDDPNAEADSSNKVLLYQNIEVLFVGQQAAPDLGETQETVDPATTVNSGLVTLSVPAEAASRIAFAVDNDLRPYLTLVPPDNTPVNVPAIDGGNVLDSGLTPYEGENEL